MQIRQIRKKRAQELPFIFLVLFTCTYFIYNDLGVSAYVPAGICLILFAFGFFYQLCREKTGLFLSTDPIRMSFFGIAIVMFLIFLRVDSAHSRANIYFIGIILFCAFMLLFSNPNQSSAQKSLDILLTASLAAAAFTIFFSLFKNVYRIVIYPLLGSEHKQYFDLTSVRGYGVSLGGVTFSSYMMAMGVAIINGNIICNKKPGEKTYLQQLFLGGTILISLLFIGRKGELICVVLAFALLWIIDSFLKKGRIRRRNFIAATAILMALIIGAIIFIPYFLGTGLLDRYISFFSRYSSGQDITSGRVPLWKWGWELFIQHPIFGGGLGSYSRFIPESVRVTGSGTDVLSPHIVYLHFLCEFGIVGFFLLMIPLGYIFKKTLHRYIQLTRLRISGGDIEANEKAIRVNAVSLYMQVFFAFLFFFDQTFSLAHFWLFYCIAVYLSSASMYYCAH